MKKFDEKKIAAIVALTPLQEGILFHYLKEPASLHYSEQLVLNLSGELQLDFFKKAWEYIVRSNEALRTCFRWEKLEKPVQIVLKERYPDLKFFDLSILKFYDEKYNHFEKIKREDRQKKFDLSDVPFRIVLCKFSNKDYRLIISNHHILYDGWSSGIILKEFFQVYTSLVEEKSSSQLSKTKPHFSEFVHWIYTQDSDKHNNFWQNYLLGITTPTKLSICKKVVNQVQDRVVKEKNFEINNELKKSLLVFLKEKRITLATLFYSVWGILLQKYCDCDDVIFGTTVSGRSAPIAGIEDMVGLFINTIPLRIKIESGETVFSLLMKVNRFLSVRGKYEGTPLVNIKSCSNLQPHEELFDSLLILENYPLDRRLMEENSELPLVVKSYSMVESTPYPITMSIITGDVIIIRFSFDTSQFTCESISRLLIHFKTILVCILEDTFKEICGIEILTREEKNQILYMFNNVIEECPNDILLHHLFIEKAAQSPDHIAVIGPKLYSNLNKNPNSIESMVGTPDFISVSYRKLKSECDLLAVQLKNKGVVSDTIVAVMIERSIDMIIGILGILSAGGAYLPIDASYPEERFNYILDDSSVKLILTLRGLPKVDELKNNRKNKKDVEFLFLDTFPIMSFQTSGCSNFSQFQTNIIEPKTTSLAYVIYTSGSTGRPKGVMVNHASIVNTLRALECLYPLGRTDVYLLKTSYFFDVSLTELFGWFFGKETGGRLAILEPGAEKEPRVILDIVEKMQVSHINFVPSMFNVLGDSLTIKNIKQASSLKYIFLAGEVLLPEIVNKFRRWNQAIYLENLYGPTEAAIYSSYFSVQNWSGNNDIPIGKPLTNTTLFILNSYRRLQAIGITGELVIGGLGLARGYLNQPELTGEKFIHSDFYLRDFSTYIYMTGDLARWMEDGSIEFLGRKDGQVKIRGFRIEVGEIENQLLKLQSITEVVVTARENKDGEKHLCAYIVPRSDNDYSSFQVTVEALKRHLLQAMPYYMVPSFFVPLEKIPLTFNGKVDRTALPEPTGTRGRKFIPPRNNLERALVDIWSQVLGIQKNTIGIEDNFFECGGHSLKAARLLGYIHKKLEVEIPLSQLFKTPTIQQLSSYINLSQKIYLSPIESVEEKEYYELAPFQKRFFVFWQLKPDDISYNVSEIMMMEGRLSREKFQDIFKQMILRHESLRTSFHVWGGEPVQRVHADVHFEIECRDLEKVSRKPEEASAKEIKNFIRPFDLTQTPLLRLGIISCSEEKQYLLFDLHHIVSDGVSIGIIIKDFLTVYAGEKLPALNVRYKDFVSWRKKKSLKAAPRKKEIHYQETVLNLPLDFPRPSVPDFKGKTIKFKIGEMEHALNSLARQEDSTLYMVMLAAFTIFLSRITGQENIIVGSPMAGRQHPDLEGLIGLFINPLVMQNFPHGQQRFPDFLREVKSNALDAYENQDYQYEYLVETIVAARTTGHNPFYDVMFVLQNMEMPEIEIPGMNIIRDVSENSTSKFDMTLYYEEYNSTFKLEYNPSLFKEATARRFIRYFEKVLEQIVENPRQPLAEIEIITNQEKQQILYGFNDTVANSPNSNTIHRIFSNHVKKTPDYIALVGREEARKKRRDEEKIKETPFGQILTFGDVSLRVNIQELIFLSYKELNEKSDRLAQLLVSKGVVPDTIVAIMLERSIEMIIGLLGILKAGGAYVPIHTEYPKERINFLLKDSNVKILLTTSNLTNQVEIRRRECTRNFEVLILDTLSYLSIKTLDLPNVTISHSHRSPETFLAYIIYTSGSTGKPKGVLVNHSSIVNTLWALEHMYPFTRTDVYLLKTSHLFDVSLAELFGWFFGVEGGGRLTILEPGAEKDPRSILDTLEKMQVTHVNFVPSMFNVLTDQLYHGNIAKLSSLKYIFLAGEALLPEVVNKFQRWNQVIRLENLYGPTEAAIYASRFRLKDWNGNGDIPIGKPIENTQLYILDCSNGMQPLGISGELAIGGLGLARGYLNRPELTVEKFIQPQFYVDIHRLILKLESPHSPAHLLTYSPIYRTGDLARWLEDGNIEFLGRIDHQVKIRGFRIELGEIQNQLLKNQLIKEVVVTSRENKEGEKYICAYIVPRSAKSFGATGEMSESLKKYLLQVVPDYMVPSFFVLVHKIPLTSNGKVDRSALPEPTWERDMKYTAPRNKREQILAGIWAQLLNLQPGTVGIDDNFSMMGGHSLKATLLVSRIHKEFNVNIPLGEIFKTPTIRSISNYIKSRNKRFYSSIKPVEKKEYYPLSSAQKRLYIIRQMNLNCTAYNIASAISLNGKLDRDKLQNVFMKLIRRHESLRTSFEIIAAEPVQKIHDVVEFEVKYYHLGKTGMEEESYKSPIESNGFNADGVREHKNKEPGVESYIKKFIHPFDLSHAPLLRVGIIKTGIHKYIVIVEMHHIISDGMSIEIIIKDFAAIYTNTEELPILNIQYKDYSEWQQQERQKDLLKQQKKYWLSEFTGEIPLLRLPLDFPRPEVQRSTGSTEAFVLEEKYTEQLKVMAGEEGATIFMIVLSLFMILLSKISGQVDIVVGTPIAGRRNNDLSTIVGMFVNTLPLRNSLQPEQTFRNFLDHIKKKAWDAFENQDYPFEELVEQAGVARDSSRNPLFDVMFSWQNPDSQDMSTLRLPGLILETCDYQIHESKFDMTLTGIEKSDNIYFTLTYNTDLFTKTTVRRFVGYFKGLVSVALEFPVKKLSEIDILPAAEKRQLLFNFNTTTEEFPERSTIRLLFEEQVEKSPNNIASVGRQPTFGQYLESDSLLNKDKKVSRSIDNRYELIYINYTTLNQKANQLAHRLIQKGVRPDTIVGIMIEPSLEMIIGILAILKAGGAYLPLDPQQPAERVTYMLIDSQAPVLLTSPLLVKTLSLLKTCNQKLLYFDSSAQENVKEINPEMTVRPQDVIYTIYTSGTTGKSKGTLIENINLVNYIHWFKKKVHITGNDRTVLTSSFAFDLGYTVIYSSLLSGSLLHFIPRENYLSPENLLEYIQRHRVTYIKITPSLFSTIVNSYKFSQQICKSLRLILLGGEAVKLYDIEKAHSIGPHLEIMNHYGPTEATIGCIAQVIDFSKWEHYKKNTTIGTPIDNMKVVILDWGLNLSPIGTPGELCVYGTGGARGYLNQPQLTAEKFIRLQIYTELHGVILESPPPHSPTHPFNHSTLYRTGDLARWRHAGLVEFLGRIDNQVKIRGYRVETGEIQSLLLNHKAVKDAVVIPMSYSISDIHLCAYIVENVDETIDQKTFPAQLNQYLAGILPDYMIPSYYVIVEQIPLTPNGKLNLKLLPKPEMMTESGYVTPRDVEEKKLVEIWMDILSPGNLHSFPGIDDNFFHRGGNSLSAILFISKIRREFHVEISLAEIFKSPTIRGLSRYIKTKSIGRYTQIEPVEKRSYYLLSSAQKRLYILQKMEEKSIGYNMPVAIELGGEIDKTKLESVFFKLIHRHESLRTSFSLMVAQPVQKIHDEVEFEIEYSHLTIEEIESGNDQFKNIENKLNLDVKVDQEQKSKELRVKSFINNFIRPFDLSQAPLLRVGMMKTGNHRHILVVDMHHIIGDGISRRLLLEEFITFMAGKNVPDLKLQYKDYAQWENRETNQDTLKRQKRYWEKQLRGEIPVLDLPGDFTRPEVQRFEGRQIRFELDQQETAALKILKQESGATLFMVLLSMYYIFLSKLTHQEDILIGTPTMGRRHADLEKVMGMFVNTLVLRNYPVGEKSYREFLKEVIQSSLEAFENQDYQYENLVDALTVTRDVSRNPLFDTMLVMQNMMPATGLPEIPGMKLAPIDYQTSKFDLTFVVAEPEDKLPITVEYSTSLFKESTIERFIIFFRKVVSKILSNPVAKLRDIEILTEEERQQLLYDFNETGAECSKNKAIHDLFVEQVGRTPDHVAIIGPKLKIPEATDTQNEGFSVSGRESDETTSINITYHELNQKACHLGYVLKQEGITAEAIVGVIMERSLEIIIGFLGILKVGGCYLPIDTHYPQERIDYILKDSKVDILLATPGIENKIRINGGLPEGVTEEAGGTPRRIIGWIDPDAKLPSNVFFTSHLNPVGTANLVYIIYTSGTTGRPKGVMVMHSNLIQLFFNNKNPFDINNRDVWTMFHSHCFDFSVWEMYGALLYGGKLIIISRATARNIRRYLEILDTRQVTVLNQTPSAFYTLLKQEELFPRYKLSVRYVIFGGEALAPGRLKPWKQRYPNSRLINMFGITETTVHVTFKEITEKEINQNLGNIGRPLPMLSTYILDNNLHVVPIGLVGELWVGGKGVARGYLNRPALTADRFIENPYKPGERLYRSGDLAYFLENGEMVYRGRKDQQVQLRGFRIELGEIENHLLKNKLIKEVVVTARENKDSENYLCAYIVPRSANSFSSPLAMVEVLKGYLLKVIPDYMIPSFFVLLNKIPLTSNGKVDQCALPEPTWEEGRKYTAPRNKTERILRGIWAQLLNLRPGTIGIDDNFFHRGGHSLKATLLVSRIHKELDINIPLVDIFRTPTIRALSGYIQTRSKEFYATIEPVEKKEYYHLSSVQKRLYIIEQMDMNSTAYNISAALSLTGNADRGKLQDVFRMLIRRHESLRTSFSMMADQPVQKIHDEVEFEIEYSHLTVEEIESGNDQFENIENKLNLDVKVDQEPKIQELRVKSFINNFIRPFDLSQAPLLRVGMMKTGNHSHILVVDMHHIISDGMSATLLLQDFMTLYSGKELLEMRLQYKDYSWWQLQEKGKSKIQKQSQFWKKEFQEKIPVLELPIDNPRPAVQKFEGSIVHFVIDKEPSDLLKSLASNEGATLYMVLLAIYTIFLSKLSNQEDIVVGTPVAGRRHWDLESIIGMFVNTLPLRSYPTGEKPFREFLAEIKKTAVNAFENQDYQYEDLVEDVVMNRDVSRNPLFDTGFQHQNLEISPLKIPGLEIKPYNCETGNSKFDLMLNAKESGEILVFSFVYSTRLFTSDTIDRFVNYFKNLVLCVLKNIDEKIGQFEIITEEEKQLILYDFNEIPVDYPKDKVIHRLFIEQVERTPEHIALVGPAARQDIQNSYICITYDELNVKSHRLAQLLIEQGVHPDTLVGIMIEKSIEMIISILGILKAGGAYLPIDPGYPEERIRFMLADSAAKWLVTASSIEEFKRLGSCNQNNKISTTTSINLNNRTLEKHPNLPTTKSPNTHFLPATSLAYIIYTSGTTGKPKGAMIIHSNVVRLMFNDSYLFDFNNHDTWTLFHRFCFDFSVWEMYGALLYGGKLIIIPGEVTTDTGNFLELLKIQRVTVLNQTPAAFYNLVNIEALHRKKELIIRYIIFGGEALKPANLKGWRERYPETRLINMYGITETTVHVTYKEITEREIRFNSGNIGKAIPTLNCYIMDNNLHLLPTGVPGELCIGGKGVGKGYLNRVELTKEKFVENPYKKGERLFKSGDLVKLLKNGEMKYIGRIDRQVKIRGFRIEIGEIENHLRSYKQIKEAIVVVRENSGDKYLCAYIVSYNPLPVSDIKGYLGKYLPDYMIPLYFVSMARIPLTINGKVDEKVLPEPQIEALGDGTPVEPRGWLEKKLAAFWAEVLGIEKELIGIDANFFHLGGHSLKAAVLISKLHKEMYVKLPLADIFRIPTIRGQAERIKGMKQVEYNLIRCEEEKEFYSTSYTQKRIWFLNQQDVGSSTFNMPGKITLKYKVNNRIIREALKQIIQRHESFRTSFEVINNQLVQIVKKEVVIPLKEKDFSSITFPERKRKVKEVEEEIATPFILAQMPLLRVILVKWAENHYEILFNMHHIVSDGWSKEILKEEFNIYINAFRQGNPDSTEPLALRYRDYAAWQNQLLTNKKAMADAKEFWKEYLGGNLPVLNLPNDYSTVKNSKSTASYRWVIPEELTLQLKNIAVTQQASLFMVLLAGFTMMLYQVTNQEDIIMAIPAATRSHENLKNVVGLFVNTLIIRSRINPQQFFMDFFTKLQDHIFSILEYQDIPLELICSELKIKYPTIHVFFNMINTGNTQQENLEDQQSRHNQNVQDAKFDIVCYVNEYRNSIEFNCHYFKDRYKTATIEMLMELYKTILGNLCMDPKKKIKEYRFAASKRKLKRFG